MEDLLKKANGPVNLWLDGHWSQGGTFKDENDTPIVHELNSVSKRFGIDPHFEFAVFVDDVRLFASQHKEDSDDVTRAGYPDLQFLADWAAKHKLWWTIELDIFCARTTPV